MSNSSFPLLVSPIGCFGGALGYIGYTNEGHNRVFARRDCRRATLYRAHRLVREMKLPRNVTAAESIAKGVFGSFYLSRSKLFRAAVEQAIAEMLEVAEPGRQIDLVIELLDGKVAVCSDPKKKECLCQKQ